MLKKNTMQYTIYAILQRQLTLRWKQKKLKKKKLTLWYLEMISKIDKTNIDTFKLIKKKNHKSLTNQDIRRIF